MPVEFSDAELAILAMACRQAAHTANGRTTSDAKRGTFVTPAQFVMLAERIESHRATALARDRVPIDTALAEWRALHGKPKGD